MLPVKPADVAPQAADSKRREPHRLKLLIKRVIDLGVALVALIALSPLLVVVALGTRATLGSPIFFRQLRPGLKGRPFRPVKFRTMRSGNAPDHERITRLGGFLRRFSLDELPQLWNVVRGEMSLVGPRPLLMAYLKRYPPRLAKRHDMRPGITGWCQVNGRNGVDWTRKFECDVWYVENWSLFLDFKILFMTVDRVLHPSGIEGPGQSWPEILGIGPEGPDGEGDARSRELL